MDALRIQIANHGEDVLLARGIQEQVEKEKRVLEEERKVCV